MSEMSFTAREAAIMVGLADKCGNHIENKNDNLVSIGDFRVFLSQARYIVSKQTIHPDQRQALQAYGPKILEDFIKKPQTFGSPKQKFTAPPDEQRNVMKRAYEIFGNFEKIEQISKYKQLSDTFKDGKDRDVGREYTGNVFDGDYLSLKDFESR
jgi:hypothetical protein